MIEKRIEDMMKEVLSGEILRNALEFADYLRANEMITNGGEISYRGKMVCYMHLDSAGEYPSPWTIWTEGDYSSERQGFSMDEPMKEIAWAHVNICGDCGAGCNPGKRKVIFGKEFDNVCSADMAFHIPDTETLQCIKKLLAMRKDAILSENE